MVLAVARVTGLGARAVAEQGALIVYSKWVKLPSPRPAPGSLLVVEDQHGDVLGCGFYDNKGPVALRLVELGDCSFRDPAEAIMDRISRAFSLREKLGMTGPGRGYRLVFSDGDMMPGLVVDVYDDLAVTQSSSIVWDVNKALIVKAILEVVDGIRGVYEKSTQRTRVEIGLEPREGLLWGSKKRAVIEEGGLRLVADPVRGQKTGLFLDQALNRVEAEKLVEPGVRVLDLFSYTGGFALHALQAGAREAVVVEQDTDALQLLKENIELNKIDRSRVRIVNDDVWRYLRISSGERFDAVFVDPPAFIPSRQVYEKGLEAYRHLYRRALEKLRDQGLLFYSSCSAFLARSEFTKLVGSVLGERNYTLIGGVRGASPDHPPRPSAPYLDYLKAVYVLAY